MTSTTGDSMTGNKTFISAVIGWALVVVLTVSGGAYVYTSAASSNARVAVASAQAAQIAALTAENKAMNKRLGICLGDAALYKSYNEQNKVAMQQVSDKWGANYRIPLKDVITSYDTANSMMDCL